MSRNLQVGNDIYIIPDQGDNPPWGEDVSDWMSAVTDTLSNEVRGPNDILPTSSNLANNQVTPANISGLIFDVSEVLSVEIKYYIKRIYNSNTTTIVESGTIVGHFDGSQFTITQDTTQDVGVEISVTNGGVFQYISSNLSGHTSSIIRFKSKTLDQ
jgi:hypothetical protein